MPVRAENEAVAMNDAERTCIEMLWEGSGSKISGLQKPSEPVSVDCWHRQSLRERSVLLVEQQRDALSTSHVKQVPEHCIRRGRPISVGAQIPALWIGFISKGH